MLKLPSKQYLEERKLREFAEAFSTGTSSFLEICLCQKTFYDPYGHWDYSENELKELEAGGASAVDEVSTIKFENKVYVRACDCWHKRALQIIGFVDSHCEGLVVYLVRERTNSISDLQDEIDRLELQPKIPAIDDFSITRSDLALPERKIDLQ